MSFAQGGPRWILPIVAACGVLLAGCGGGVVESGGEPLTRATGSAGQRYPNVVKVDVTRTGANTYEFTVTVSSPYDSSRRYADAFRVKGKDGTVYGVRELMHPHTSEQPFTRSLSGVEIPDSVEKVVVEGRDLRNGYGGQTRTVALPR